MGISTASVSIPSLPWRERARVRGPNGDTLAQAFSSFVVLTAIGMDDCLDEAHDSRRLTDGQPQTTPSVIGGPRRVGEAQRNPPLVGLGLMGHISFRPPYTWLRARRPRPYPYPFVRRQSAGVGRVQRSATHH